MLKSLSIVAALLATPALAEQTYNTASTPAYRISEVYNLVGTLTGRVLQQQKLLPGTYSSASSTDCHCVTGLVAASAIKATNAAMAHYRRATEAGFKHVEIVSINSYPVSGKRVLFGGGRTYDYMPTPPAGSNVGYNDSTGYHLGFAPN